jgi:hypothetical protein
MLVAKLYKVNSNNGQSVAMRFIRIKATKEPKDPKDPKDQKSFKGIKDDNEVT